MIDTPSAVLSDADPDRRARDIAQSNARGHGDHSPDSQAPRSKLPLSRKHSIDLSGLEPSDGELSSTLGSVRRLTRATINFEGLAAWRRDSTGSVKFGAGNARSHNRARLQALLDEEGQPRRAKKAEQTYSFLGNRSPRQFIEGPFSLFMGCLIILNALVMFAQLELDGCDTARSLDQTASCALKWDAHSRDWFLVAEHSFNAIFAFELAIRLAVFRCDFFKKGYNLLDGFIVLGTVGRSYIIAPLMAASGESNFSYARLIRLLMMFRAFRVIRVLELFHTLRVLIGTIASSFFCLFWSMIILFILQIVVALLLCQSVQDYILNDGSDFKTRQWVNQYYGSSSKALYTMFELTFSGCWPNYARPLVEDVHVGYSIIFVVYVTAVVFAVTRIITALFLKDTMRIAQQDAQMMVQEKMMEKVQARDTLKEIFLLADTSGDGYLTLGEFETLVARPKIAAWLDVLGLDVKDVHTLFHLLDDGDGHIDAEEFVNGMMELKGYAREMDVIQIRHDTKRIMQRCDHIREECNSFRRYLAVQLSPIQGAQGRVPPPPSPSSRPPATRFKATAGSATTDTAARWESEV